MHQQFASGMEWCDSRIEEIIRAANPSDTSELTPRSPRPLSQFQSSVGGMFGHSGSANRAGDSEFEAIGTDRSEDEGLSGDSTATHESEAAERSLAATDGLISIINKQVEDAFLPLLSVLRGMEEDEHKHQEKLLAIEKRKLALKNEKFQLFARHGAPSWNSPISQPQVGLANFMGNTASAPEPVKVGTEGKGVSSRRSSGSDGFLQPSKLSKTDVTKYKTPDDEDLPIANKLVGFPDVGSCLSDDSNEGDHSVGRKDRSSEGDHSHSDKNLPKLDKVVACSNVRSCLSDDSNEGVHSDEFKDRSSEGDHSHADKNLPKLDKVVACSNVRSCLSDDSNEGVHSDEFKDQTEGDPRHSDKNLPNLDKVVACSIVESCLSDDSNARDRSDELKDHLSEGDHSHSVDLPKLDKVERRGDLGHFREDWVKTEKLVSGDSSGPPKIVVKDETPDAKCVRHFGGTLSGAVMRSCSPGRTSEADNFRPGIREKLVEYGALNAKSRTLSEEGERKECELSPGNYRNLPIPDKVVACPYCVTEFGFTPPIMSGTTFRHVASDDMSTLTDEPWEPLFTGTCNLYLGPWNGKQHLVCSSQGGASLSTLLLDSDRPGVKPTGLCVSSVGQQHQPVSVLGKRGAADCGRHEDVQLPAKALRGGSISCKSEIVQVGSSREAPSMHQIATKQNPQGKVGVLQGYRSFLPWSDLPSTQHTGALHEEDEHRIPGLELDSEMSTDSPVRPEHVHHSGETYEHRIPGLELDSEMSADSPVRPEHVHHSGETYNMDIAQQREILIFPEGEDDAVTISGSDLESLQPMSFLSNNIIDFYIKFLERRLSSEDRERFYFFRSFFFTKLVGDSRAIAEIHERGVGFDRVRSWTGEVNLFEKDYVFVPILRSSHWSLIIVGHLNSLTNLPDKRRGSPCVYHLDPIEGKHESFEDHIRSYIIQSCMERYRDSNDRDRIILALACEMKYVRAQVPQQAGNGHDCGVYLLHYVEVFLRESTSPRFNFASASNIWGPHFAEDASAKRTGIQRLIFELSNNRQEQASRPMDIQPRPQPKASDARKPCTRRKCLPIPPEWQSKLSKKWTKEDETELLLERMVEGDRMRKATEQLDRMSQDMKTKRTKLGLMRTEAECRASALTPTWMWELDGQGQPIEPGPGSPPQLPTPPQRPPQRPTHRTRLGSPPKLHTPPQRPTHRARPGSPPKLPTPPQRPTPPRSC